MTAGVAYTDTDFVCVCDACRLGRTRYVGRRRRLYIYDSLLLRSDTRLWTAFTVFRQSSYSLPTVFLHSSAPLGAVFTARSLHKKRSLEDCRSQSSRLPCLSSPCGYFVSGSSICPCTCTTSIRPLSMFFCSVSAMLWNSVFRTLNFSVMPLQ